MNENNVETKTIEDMFILFSKLPKNERDSLLHTYPMEAIFRTVTNEDYYKSSLDTMNNSICQAKEALANLELNQKALKDLHAMLKFTNVENNKVYQIMELYKSLDNEKKIEVNDRMQNVDSLAVSIGKFKSNFLNAFKKAISEKDADEQ